jgi:uncharacterized protein YdaU (DUF1376 family)
LFAESPCFTWWPKDTLSDSKVQVLSLEAEGAYRRLIDFCWIEGRVPSDPKQLGRLCKIDTSTKEGLERAEALRDELEPLFVQAADHPGCWQHKRVEHERLKQRTDREARAAKEQAEHERLSRAGRAGAEARLRRVQSGGRQ